MAMIVEIRGSFAVFAKRAVNDSSGPARAKIEAALVRAS